MASLRAEFKAAVKVLVVEVNAEFRWNSMKLGAATVISIAAIAITVINSIKVKPRRRKIDVRMIKASKV